MNTINQIKKSVENANYTAIVCHYHPDGDTLGSAFGLHRTLAKLSIKSDVLCENKLPDDYHFLKGIDVLNDFNKEKYDLIIFVDCASLSMSKGLLKDVDIKDYNTINIDHHGTNEMYADINYVDGTSSSAGEMVLNVIRSMDVEIDKTTAEYLYTSIMTDTGQFAYSYTSARTHNNAAFLIECGADFASLHKAVFKTTSLKKVLLQKQMLDNMELHLDNKLVISRLDEKDFKVSGATHEDTNSLVNFLLSIENTKVAVLIREISKNSSKVSFRSTEDVDISKVATLFGGGGHKQAAGATIHHNTQQSKTEIINAIINLGILK